MLDSIRRADTSDRSGGFYSPDLTTSLPVSKFRRQIAENRTPEGVRSFSFDNVTSPSGFNSHSDYNRTVHEVPVGASPH